MKELERTRDNGGSGDHLENIIDIFQELRGDSASIEWGTKVIKG
jgi:hypothetical protein